MAAAGVHANIVRYYFAWMEAERDGVHFYIQQEKCGSSLGQRFCVDKRPLKEAELVDILRQVATSTPIQFFQYKRHTMAQNPCRNCLDREAVMR